MISGVYNHLDAETQTRLVIMSTHKKISNQETFSIICTDCVALANFFMEEVVTEHRHDLRSSVLHTDSEGRSCVTHTRTHILALPSLYSYYSGELSGQQPNFPSQVRRKTMMVRVINITQRVKFVTNPCG